MTRLYRLRYVTPARNGLYLSSFSTPVRRRRTRPTLRQVVVGAVEFLLPALGVCLLAGGVLALLGVLWAIDQLLRAVLP